MDDQDANVPFLGDALEWSERGIVITIDGAVARAVWPDFFENIDHN